MAITPSYTTETEIGLHKLSSVFFLQNNVSLFPLLKEWVSLDAADSLLSFLPTHQQSMSISIYPFKWLIMTFFTPFPPLLHMMCVSKCDGSLHEESQSACWTCQSGFHEVCRRKLFSVCPHPFAWQTAQSLKTSF